MKTQLIGRIGSPNQTKPTIKLLGGNYVNLTTDVPFDWRSIDLFIGGKIIVKSSEHLREIVKEVPSDANLNKLDVSQLTDMSNVFQGSDFNGDISEWDVSNVKSMYGMFAASKFNGDISKWNVGNVNTMDYMFAKSEFNGDISNWDVINIESTVRMFYGSKFCGDISKWDVYCLNANHMFTDAPLNYSVAKWRNKTTSDYIEFYIDNDLYINPNTTFFGNNAFNW